MSIPLSLSGMTVRLKVILVSPDGKKVEVLETSYRDPFSANYVYFLYGLLGWPYLATGGGVRIMNVQNVAMYFWSPGGVFASPLASLCVVNCPNTDLLSGVYTLTVPGFWLYSTPFVSPDNWAGALYNFLIYWFDYQTPTISPGPGNVPEAPYGGTASFTIAQTIINRTLQTYTAYSAALIVAAYMSGDPTPYLFDIAYFNFPSPIPLSPRSGIFITATFSMPT